MKKIVERRHKPVLPIYAVGLVWLVGALALPIYKLSTLLIVAGLSLLAYALLSKLCPDRVEQQEIEVSTGDEQADAVLAAIRENRLRLRGINDRIPDDGLSAAILRMEKACDGILSRLEERPQSAREVRRFANHYLPDAVKILDLYAELEEKNVAGANAAEVRREVEENAGVIAKAFENQLDHLYDTSAMDITTDLDVLKGMLKGQGLV